MQREVESGKIEVDSEESEVKNNEGAQDKAYFSLSEGRDAGRENAGTSGRDDKVGYRKASNKGTEQENRRILRESIKLRGNHAERVEGQGNGIVVSYKEIMEEFIADISYNLNNSKTQAIFRDFVAVKKAYDDFFKRQSLKDNQISKKEAGTKPAISMPETEGEAAIDYSISSEDRRISRQKEAEIRLIKDIAANTTKTEVNRVVFEDFDDKINGYYDRDM